MLDPISSKIMFGTSNPIKIIMGNVQSKSIKPQRNSGVRKAEIKKLQELINSGKANNVEEMYIVISKELARSFNGQAGVTIENLPLNAAFNVSQDESGKYMLHVKFQKKTTVDELTSYHQLLKDGAITEDEFSAIKTKLIDKIGSE